jgi:hypothetical protein
VMTAVATIQAFDDPDGTIYLLRREGMADVTADWPHPLMLLAPHAVRLPSITGSDTRDGITVHIADNSGYIGKVNR